MTANDKGDHATRAQSSPSPHQFQQFQLSAEVQEQRWRHIQQQQMMVSKRQQQMECSRQQQMECSRQQQTVSMQLSMHQQQALLQQKAQIQQAQQMAQHMAQQQAQAQPLNQASPGLPMSMLTRPMVPPSQATHQTVSSQPLTVDNQMQHRNHALEDYYLQLRLLEQQDKKRSLVSREEQHDDTSSSKGSSQVTWNPRGKLTGLPEDPGLANFQSSHYRSTTTHLSRRSPVLDTKMTKPVMNQIKQSLRSSSSSEYASPIPLAGYPYTRGSKRARSPSRKSARRMKRRRIVSERDEPLGNEDMSFIGARDIVDVLLEQWTVPMY
jgi:hypothetical protein